jgi:hypothetical protein
MSANGFQVIEQKPVLGRDCTSEDERPGSEPVVMLTYHVWQDRYDHLAQNRLEVGLVGGMFTVFAGIALVLASVGLYAVIAHSVSQRTQEIGVRRAMGGTDRDILRLVLAQGLRPLGLGVAIGLPAAFGITHVLRTALIGVRRAILYIWRWWSLALAGVLVVRFRTQGHSPIRPRHCAVSSRCHSTGWQNHSKTEPLPNWLSTVIFPSIRSMTCFTMESPKPVPPTWRERALSTR